MRNYVAAIVLFLISATATVLGTPQIPDVLIYEGKEYPIQNEILHEYFKKYPDRDPKPKDDWCSALWRGYRATFEVSNKGLYLKDVVVNFCFGTPKSELAKVVPSGERLLVDWFAGLLRSGYGSNSEDPYGFESLDAYEEYSFFEIDGGKLREARQFDNKGYRAFKKRQFQAFRKTKEYESEIKRMIADGKTDRATADASIEPWIFSYTKTFLVK